VSHDRRVWLAFGESRWDQQRYAIFQPRELWPTMQATFSWQIPAIRLSGKLPPSDKPGGYHRRRLAGTTGSADGAGDAARFYFPAGVARDGAGYFYVADFGNNNISHGASRGAG